MTSPEKWIIKLTLPTGNAYAFSALKGKFALVPMDKHGMVKGANTWPDRKSAETYYHKQVAALPPDMKPFHEVGRVEILQAMEPS